MKTIKLFIFLWLCKTSSCVVFFPILCDQISVNVTHRAFRGTAVLWTKCERHHTNILDIKHDRGPPLWFCASPFDSLCLNDEVACFSSAYKFCWFIRLAECSAPIPLWDILQDPVWWFGSFFCFLLTLLIHTTTKAKAALNSLMCWPRFLAWSVEHVK